LIYLSQMNRIFVLAMLVAGLTPLSGSGAVIEQTQPTSLSMKQQAAIRKVVEAAMAKYQAPGSTFAVGLGGEVVWAEGFGLADVENRVPAEADTVYRTASIGKPMTATAAMELAEQGKLDLDKPIQEYCPRFPTKPWPISSRDLISHTSGIRHYGGTNEEAELFNVRHYDHVSDAIDIFKDDPLKQEPGADYLYSTWGYVALGCVMEGATGKEFRSLIKELVFDPAGMTKTRDDDPRAIIPNRARGYIFEKGRLKNSRWADMSSKMAAGGFVTTAPDLVRFMNAWMGGKLVIASTMSAMLTPYKLPKDGTLDNFGLGWYIDEYRGMRTGGYGGGTPEVSGVILFIPEKMIAIAGVFNLEEIPGTERGTIIRAIADVILGYDQH
jgi:serine beta-lactamase-like protein LACTB, mitochondrial